MITINKHTFNGLKSSQIFLLLIPSSLFFLLLHTYQDAFNNQAASDFTILIGIITPQAAPIVFGFPTEHMMLTAYQHTVLP